MREIFKKQVLEFKKKSDKWNEEAINVARNSMPEEMKRCEFYFDTIGDWDCSKSPFGLCAYFHYKDPVHDHCVFCRHPEERK